MQLSDDQQLVSKARNGDKEAFDILHKKYRRQILNYLYRFLGSYEMAEELTQDTFLQVYMHLDSYVPEGKFSSWVYKIATNIAKNKFRSLSREKKTSLDGALSGEETVALKDALGSKEATPEEIAKRHELESEIQRVMASLPPDYRAVLILCEMQGLSYEEAAKILNCSIDIIGVRLNRARSEMRRKIDPSLFT